MSKTQLQANNARLASLIDTLKGKAAGGSGGDSTVSPCDVVVNSNMIILMTLYREYTSDIDQCWLYQSTGIGTRFDPTVTAGEMFFVRYNDASGKNAKIETTGDVEIVEHNSATRIVVFIPRGDYCTIDISLT